MPRSPRYNSPGAIHHVMLRGNQGRPIFFSDGDRVQCCLLIQEVVERYGHRIHGYCLMSNHIHLAWQQGTEGLSSAVQNFAFRYAQRINRLRKEVGHVFQGRFKSILVNKENDLTKLVRYIHLNPVRAGIVKRPEDYKWSGHNAYLGTDPVARLECDYVLKKYSDERDIAIRQYNEFIYSGIGCEPDLDFKMGLRSGIIGDDEFIQTIISGESENRESLDITISDLVNHVCTKYGVSEEEIISESRARDLAHVRAIITLLSRSIEGISIIEVAKKLKRDPGGLSRLANKLDKKCTISTLLKHEVISLKTDLLSIRYPANSHCNKSTSHV